MPYKKSSQPLKMRNPYKVIGAILLATALILGTLELTNTTHFLHRHASPSAVSETTYNQGRKEAVVDNNGTPNTNPSETSKGGPTSSYTPPNSADNISLSARRTGPSEVTITSKLKGYSDGSCVLTITNGPKTLSRTAQVIYAPEFSTCAGFSIPLAGLGSGTWDISLAVTSGNVTLSKSIIYEVQ